MSETQTAEPSKLELVIQSSGVEHEGAVAIRSALSPFFAQAIEWQNKVDTITDAKSARALRLVLKGVRVNASHKKDELKKGVLSYTNAIDSCHRLIKETIEPLEVALEAIEKKEEREEAARKDALRLVRINQLAEFSVDTTFIDLVNMPDAAFAQLLESSKVVHAAKLEAAKKAEADRIAKEQAEADERERVKAENERLKKEAFEQAKAQEEERNKAAQAAEKMRLEREAFEEATRKQRQEIEAKAKAGRDAALAKAAEAQKAADEAIRKEREARVKLEVEAAAKAKAEADAKAAEEAARKKAARAPEREKVKAFAATIRALSVPKLESAEGRAIGDQIFEQIQKFAAWLDKKGESL